jgi:hypothetical protein
MSRRCDGVPLPDYYIGPTRRPYVRNTGRETGQEMLWDMTATWQTTAEWLAWVRRRDGKPRYWNGRKWHHPIRPIIAAHSLPWTTMKARRLP